LPGNEKVIVKHKGGTDKPIKVKNHIAKPKIAEGMAWVKKNKKTWMIHLQQCYLHGLWKLYAGFGAAFCM